MSTTTNPPTNSGNYPDDDRSNGTNPTTNTSIEPVVYVSSNRIFSETDNRPHVRVTAHSSEHLMLLDSGSQITVVGLNWIDKLLPDWKVQLRPSGFHISTVDEKVRLPILGTVDITYSYIGLTRRVPTVVLSVPSRVPILGKDFMSAFGLDFARMTANGWSSIPIEYSPAATITKEVNTLTTMVTANQLMGWMHYHPDSDTQVNTLSCTDSDEVAIVTENEKDLGFVFPKVRVDDTEAIPVKNASVSIPHQLTTEQRHMLSTVLQLFRHTAEAGTLNKTTKIEHIIDTEDAKPIMKKQYPFSPYIMEKVQAELDKMLERDIIMTIEYSPWRAPILAVDKKDGGCRVCLDARELNRVTVPNAYPITDVNYILSRIRKARYLSSIDLSQAFFQIPLEKNSRYKTAFAFGNQLYCFKRMTMGLRNSPATLAVLVDTIFRDLYPYAFAYVDDFIICTETFEEHLRILTIIAKRLADAGLTISPNKSYFCCKRLEFLGYVLSEEGLSANPEKVSALHNFPRPETAKEARRFIGAAGWYRKFIPDFAEVSAPIHDLYKGNKKGKIEWTEAAEQAFLILKQRLTSTPVLAMADYTLPFKIYSDASLLAGAAVLTQEFPEGERVIQYFSKKFTRPEQNYSASERECLAVLLAVEKFRPYVEGVQFTVVTDHSALRWLMSIKDPKGRLARWAIRLQAFDMKIEYKAGKHMELPDALSRAIALIDIQPDDTQDQWYNSMMEKASKHPLDKYKVENGKLYHRLKFTTYSGERLWTLCVPTEKRLEVLKEHHDDYSHQGVWKTYHRVKMYYYWPDMQESVYQYVRKCSICRQVKPSNENTRTTHGSYREPKAPGRQLSIDLVGKLPMSKNQNQYLFVVLDCFSRYAFVKPIRFATSTVIIQYLKEVVFMQNGCPEIIISDNGKQFIGHAFEEMCQSYNIQHWKTPVYHPKANQVESTNKNIKMALKTYVMNDSNHGNWEKHIAKVVHDLNTTPHTSTGHTPFYLNFGREHIRDGKEYSHLMDSNPFHCLDSNRLNDIREESREKQGDTYEETKVRQSGRTKTRHFPIGAEVFIPNNKLSSAGVKYNAKLAPGKLRAYVKKKIGENTYELVDPHNKPIGVHHADHIMTR